VRRTEPATATTEPPGRLTLTGEGMAWLGATILLGGVGWMKSINLVLILAYMMAVALFLNGLLARLQVRRVSVMRDSTPPVYAGEETSLRIEVTNTATRRATVSVEESISDEAVSWLVYRIAAQRMVSCAARREFPKRGRFARAISVASGFPLGLVRYERPLAAGQEFVVLPAAGVADANGLRQWILRQPGGDGRLRKVLRRVTTDQADVRGVRPYRPGDPIRGIHWRSSARRGELMVREYDVAPSPDLVLVVEPWLPLNPTAMHQATLEAALSLAVTIARTWRQAYGARVTVAVAGDANSVRFTGSNDSDLREALIPLAEVVGAPNFDALGTAAFDRAVHHAARVLVSSRPHSPYAATLTRATGHAFFALSPADRLPWYEAPGVRDQRTEVSQEGRVFSDL